MRGKRSNHSNKFKTQVALEAIKGQMTMAEISSKYGIHPTQIIRWKNQVLEHIPDIFNKKKDDEKEELKQQRDELYKKIGQMNIELDWLKKKSGFEY